MAKNNLIRVKNTQAVQKYLNKEGKNFNNDFRNEMIVKMRDISKELQTGINNAAAGGVVPFTGNAMLYFFNKRVTGVTCTIQVKD
ncbi:hypothetical protein FVW90_23915, partial [Salmonella enterica]|nr:hypothetical protein [Salmonella enterica]